MRGATPTRRAHQITMVLMLLLLLLSFSLSATATDAAVTVTLSSSSSTAGCTENTSNLASSSTAESQSHSNLAQAVVASATSSASASAYSYSSLSDSCPPGPSSSTFSSMWSHPVFWLAAVLIFFSLLCLLLQLYLCCTRRAYRLRWCSCIESYLIHRQIQIASKQTNIKQQTELLTAAADEHVYISV